MDLWKVVFVTLFYRGRSMYQLQKEEKLAEGVKRVVLEQIDESVTLLMGFRDYRDEALQDEDIHQVRKNIKRIRAALRLARVDIGGRVYRRENLCYGDAGRQLAPLRDSAVMVETLDAILIDFPEYMTAGLGKDSVFSEPGNPGIRQWLAAQQEEIRSRFFGQGNILLEVAQTLQEAGRRFKAFPLSQDFQVYKWGLQRVYRNGRRRMVQAYAADSNPVKFHDWRKQVKYLWHQVEILQPVWPVVMVAAADELHEVSDCLGVAHDLALLHEHLQANADLWGNESYWPQLLTHLSGKRQELALAHEASLVTAFGSPPAAPGAAYFAPPAICRSHGRS
jgi:CHAD domain-containing protein